MRPSNTAAAVWQASGLSGSAGAGHAQHRGRHRIKHAVAVRLGDRDAVGIDRRFRLDAEFLHGAVRQHHVDGFGFLRRRGGGRIIGRDQRAVDDAALGGAGARAAGKRLQQARVPPEAAAENWSSPISMVQAPLPTGMPASVASYCASRCPCANAACGAQPPQRQRAQKRPKHRLGRKRCESCSAWSPGDGPSIRALVISFKQKTRAKQRIGAHLGEFSAEPGRRSPCKPEMSGANAPII